MLKSHTCQSSQFLGMGSLFTKVRLLTNKVLIWSGRVHTYEGHSTNDASFIAQMSAFLGCQTIIITNAVGGGIPGMQVGSFMLSTDHINTVYKSQNRFYENDTRFLTKRVQSTEAHTKDLIDLARTVAEELEIELFEGNYVWTPGPAFETPMETTILRQFGGGAFGMSTIPELLAAKQLGMD